MPEDWTSTDGAGSLSGPRSTPARSAPYNPNAPWQAMSQAPPTPSAIDLAASGSGAPADGGPLAGAPAPLPRAAEVTVPVMMAPVQRVIWIVIGTLVALDFVTAFLSAFGLAPYFFLRFFDADQKINFPTGAKTTFLLLNTLLMLACWWAARQRGDAVARGWALLAAGTGFAFIDETTYLHQSLSTTMADTFGLTGILKYSWTLLYAPAVVVIGIFLFRNLATMDPDIRKRLLPAGALFVGGALGLEPIKSSLSESTGDSGLAFRLTAAISDSLELAGLALLTGAMLIALSRITARFAFAIEEVPMEIAPAMSAAGASGQFPSGAADPYPAFSHMAPPGVPPDAAAQYPPVQPYAVPQYTGQPGGYLTSPQHYATRPHPRQTPAPQAYPQPSPPLAQPQPASQPIAQSRPMAQPQQQFGQRLPGGQHFGGDVPYPAPGTYAPGPDPYAATSEYPAYQVPASPEAPQPGADPEASGWPADDRLRPPTRNQPPSPGNTW
jgi:hypothetical protein